MNSKLSALSIETTDDGRVLYTKAQLAREFDLNVITVAKRLRGIEPHSQSQRDTPLYDIATAARALLDLPLPTSTSQNLRDQEIRLKIAKGKFELQRIEREERVARGELVALHDLSETLGSMLIDVRDAVMAMPDVLENECELSPEVIEVQERLSLECLQSLELKLGEYGGG